MLKLKLKTMMNEGRIVQPIGITEETNYNQSVYKTFIDNSGTLLTESLRHHLKHNVERHCDLKFYCSDSRFVRVHRSLFAAISPFLRSLVLELDPYESKEVCIFLPEMRYVELQHLVCLIYTGEIRISKRTRGTITKWLEILGIPMVLNETSTSEFGDDSSNSKLIYVHDELKRNRNEKLMCQLCRKSFKTESYMKSHLLTHTGEKPYKCSDCGKQFRYNDSLKAHMRDHTGDKFKCQYKTCDKEFNRLRDLKDHENVHQGDKNVIEFTFACSICDAKFLRKKQLSNHMETHRCTVEPCGVCGKVLKNLACLRSHMRNHTTLKNYSCGTCGKAFKRNFDLTVHLRIHSGSKPYQCNICRKTFSLSSTLAKHKRFHEKLDRVKTLTLSNVKEDSKKLGVILQREKGEKSVISSSKPILATEKMESAYFTQNTIADALIDLSQSSHIVSSVKDCTTDHHVYRGGTPQ